MKKERKRTTILTLEDAQRALAIVERKRENDRRYNQTKPGKARIRAWQKTNRDRLNKARRARYARLRRAKSALLKTSKPLTHF